MFDISAGIDTGLLKVEERDQRGAYGKSLWSRLLLGDKGHPYFCNVDQLRDPPRCNMACSYTLSAIDSIISRIASRCRHSAGIASTP